MPILKAIPKWTWHPDDVLARLAVFHSMLFLFFLYVIGHTEDPTMPMVVAVVSGYSWILVPVMVWTVFFRPSPQENG